MQFYICLVLVASPHTEVYKVITAFEVAKEAPGSSSIYSWFLI